MSNVGLFDTVCIGDFDMLNMTIGGLFLRLTFGRHTVCIRDLDKLNLTISGLV